MPTTGRAGELFGRDSRLGGTQNPDYNQNEFPAFRRTGACTRIGVRETEELEYPRPFHDKLSQVDAFKVAVSEAGRFRTLSIDVVVEMATARENALRLMRFIK